ncbi:MAG TPA: hypothetical protein VGR00_11100, partial [Thermoanaerobaculia bacterium]|nr:hypothetical protein [Thermoanaerobaculia bacterium]
MSTFLLVSCFLTGRAAAQDAPPEAAPAPISYPTLKLGGFSDIDFFATDRKAADPKSGFFEGQFTLHFTSQLHKRVSFFGEVTATARANAFVVTVERAIIRWDGSDAFKLSFGRYHTPVNYWNTAFHHGQWLQTTVSRPEMAKFGGDFIPNHFVGGLVEGGIPAGGVNLHYAVGLGNGRANDIHSAGDSGDSNNFRAWLVNVSVRPDAIYSLQAGGAYYRDKITLADNRNFDENLYSGYVVWLKEKPELIAEYAHIDHKDIATGASYQNDAWYIQA